MTGIELAALRVQIVHETNTSEYNHRLFLNSDVAREFPHTQDNEQLQYARFKLAVARVLKPRTVYEVGVGWGISAQAFLSGHLKTRFYGIDSCEMGVPPNKAVNYNPCLPCETVASHDLKSFEHPHGEIDLLHIDGGHGLEHKADDIVKAIEARPEWLLVDDVHDVMVAAGTFAGLYKACANSLQMLYFENSHTGNLLIHTARKAPEYRNLKVERY